MTLKNDFKQSLDYPFKSVIKFKNSAQILLVGIKKKNCDKKFLLYKNNYISNKNVQKKNL